MGHLDGRWRHGLPAGGWGARAAMEETVATGLWVALIGIGKVGGTWDLRGG